MTQNEIILLNAIHEYVKKENFRLGGNLSIEIECGMATSLTDFTMAATEKFIKGQKEHGGDIRDRDLDSEMALELLDLFWYNSAKSWPSINKIETKKG